MTRTALLEILATFLDASSYELGNASLGELNFTLVEIMALMIMGT
jgi:hypothetical protein